MGTPFSKHRLFQEQKNTVYNLKEDFENDLDEDITKPVPKS